ncbi:feruloyl esterase [Lentzea xinjiangensis]|uniref:Feruloyl esterase n=1 Tax=Lentzea xinjiangensis TaxID=402600 RepID=A0A1H9JQ92_9PSEU|nr:tannase/feruloyl esterase family alpha/beta hydrolase [Lentzea xinjiangensis]SEQ89111.1 feruloyl esterase [Lentzea xinjiangensis]
MRTPPRPLALLAVAVLLPGTALLAAGSAASSPGRTVPACAALDRLRIPASVMSLPTTGGRVTAATTTSAVVSGQTIEYCQVDADLHPVDPAAPAIKMRVALPHGWNR